MHIDDQLKAQNRIYFFLTLFVPNCGFYSIVRYNVYKSLHNWQILQNQDFNSVNHLLPDEILGIAKFTNIKK